nr:hypothetical protein [[Clostridium] dakarense]
MKKSIFMQIFILFAIPLTLALANTIFLSKAIFVVSPEITQIGIVKNLLLTTAIVIIVYGIYFFSSYFESLNIINEKKTM